jgi:DNA mismatch endonuclease (patch repair protein)
MPIPVPGRRPIRPDIAFQGARLAVFVDGCFWHACPEHGSSPAANGAYWASKLDRTRKRDEEGDRLLRAEGWTVLRVWEHVAVPDAERQVVAALKARSA